MDFLTKHILDAKTGSDVFEVDDTGSVVANTDELLDFVDSHPITHGLWQTNDDVSVNDLLTDEWEHVMFLYYPDSAIESRVGAIERATDAISTNPGVYALESFLEGPEGYLETHLLRYVGDR